MAKRGVRKSPKSETSTPTIRPELSLHITVSANFTFAELEHWQPSQIQALMRGIAAIATQQPKPGEGD